jgi:hypothetical protein
MKEDREEDRRARWQEAEAVFRPGLREQQRQKTRLFLPKVNDFWKFYEFEIC